MTRAVEESPDEGAIPLGAPFALELPWPPSVNRYWRRVGARTLLSREAREYRANLDLRVRQQGSPRFGERRLALHVRALPPDRRKRDLDNALKGLLDALQHAMVFADDSQIDDLRIVRGVTTPGGRVIVTIEAMP